MIETELKKNIIPPARQVKPFGQQCKWSAQQTAFGAGQHPYVPLESLQQVFPSGHSLWPSGHKTVLTLRSAGFFKSAVMISSPFVHFPKRTNAKTKVNITI